MNLNNWIELGRQHWKEFLPNRYRELKAAGTLDEALKTAAEQTYLEADQLEQSGFQPDEAWQMVRENYLLLPPEGSQRPETSSQTSQDLMSAARSGQRTVEIR